MSWLTEISSALAMMNNVSMSMAMSPFSYFDTVALLLFISPAKTSMVIFFILRYKRMRLPTCMLISFINPHHLLLSLPFIPVFFLSVSIQQGACLPELWQLLPNVLRQVVSFFHFFLLVQIHDNRWKSHLFQKVSFSGCKNEICFSFTLYHKLFGINRLILYLQQNKKGDTAEENIFQNTGKSIFFSVFFLKMFILSRMLSFYTENIYS